MSEPNGERAPSERDRESARARAARVPRLAPDSPPLCAVACLGCSVHSWDRRVWRVYGDASGGGARAREESYSPAGPHTVSSALFLREKRKLTLLILVYRAARADARSPYAITTVVKYILYSGGPMHAVCAPRPYSSTRQRINIPQLSGSAAPVALISPPSRAAL